MSTVNDPLLPEIETAMRLHEVSATQFGYCAVGDPALVARLRDGMVMRPKRRAKVMAALVRLNEEGRL